MADFSENFFEHQDLKPLILRGKNYHVQQKLKREGKTETVSKNTMGATAHKMNALDNATGVGDVKIKKDKFKNLSSSY